MKKVMMLIAGGLAFSSIGALQPTYAAGCIKGAVVGGVAGHYAGHHGLIGAGIGCAVGHHEAAKNAREQTQQNQDNQRY